MNTQANTAVLPNAKTVKVDSSEKNQAYLFKGRNGAYITLSEAAQFLLEQHSRGASFETIAEMASQRSSKPITASEAEAAYEKVIKQIEAIESKEQQLPSGFWFRFTLIPATVVSKISNLLSVAYRPIIASGLLAFIAAAVILTLLNYHTLPKDGETFWIGLALFQLSLIAHEFGHSSACARFGAAPSDIGFTIYLIYPAFYSDVSAAWELKRWQRVIVDFGGMFFQLVVGAVYTVAYLSTGHEAFFMANLLISGTIVFNLNPIFKFDGHWALADALGVTNLSQQPARIVKHFWQRLRGESIQLLPWNNWITSVLVLYSVLSFGVWLLFLWVVFPWMYREISAAPDVITHVVQAAQAGEVNAAMIMQLLKTIYMIALASLMVFNLVKPALRNIKLHQ